MNPITPENKTTSKDSLLWNRRLSIAPMLDWTDRHERYFLRQLSQHILLYSEMVVTSALIHGDPERHLQFNTEEHPVALQLGGSNPQELALCAKMGQDFGYDEINLNCGCPSDRVQNGRFGACLMAEKQRVAECVAAMKAAVKIPVTVKTRIGIDHQDSWEFLHDFVETVQQAGVDHWIIHARKAWLSGLSPKENREKPPLNYGRVSQLQRAFPQVTFSINGGVRSIETILELLNGTPVFGMTYEGELESPLPLQGVMVGREAYENPWFLSQADQRIFTGNESGSAEGFRTTGGPRFASPQEYLLSLEPYLAKQMEAGVPLHLMTRHLLGLFAGIPGARKYRQMMGEGACRKDADLGLIRRAMECVQEV